MSGWPELLRQAIRGPPPELHLYTDGSWDPTTGFGGFAIAIFLAYKGQWALFGACGGGTHGHLDSPWDIGGPPALANEQTAIAVALLWAAQTFTYLKHASLTIHYDCQVAGHAAQGTSTLTSPFMAKVRGLSQFVAALFKMEPLYAHVAAHQGEPLNELVDIMAKTVARSEGALPRPPAEICQLLQSADLTWLAATVDPTWLGVVPINATSLQWQPIEDFGPSPLAPQQLIPVDKGPLHAQTPTRSVAANILSVNALGTKNKHRYLEEQLEALGTNLAMLQETKSSEGLCESSRFLRMSTASDRHWGVGIWISKTRGALQIEGQPWRIGEADIRLILSTPRLLVVLLNKDDHKVVVVSGHCPHDAKHAEAVKFFDSLQQAVAPYKQAHIILVGIDMNGRPPSGVFGVTGGLQCGEADRNGHLAVRTFEQLGLWLPSTFAELHDGQSETYCHPQGTLHRIDFIAVGGSSAMLDVASQVCTNFDTGCERDDHWPVQLEFRCSIASGCPRRQVLRPRFDMDKLLTEEGRATMARELGKFRQPAWTCHPDLHCQLVQDHFLEIMHRHFALPARRPRASFISQTTWALRDSKLRLKLHGRHRRQLWSDLLVRAFMQWRDNADYAVDQLVCRQGLLYQITSAAVGLATQRIKECVRQGKNSFLLELAGDPGRPPGALLRQAKAAGVGGAKARPVRRPLPQLCFKDGTLADSRQDRDDLWAGHFGAQELGTRMSTDAYLAQPQKPPHQDVVIDWDIREIPSLLDVEQAFRAAPRRKSPGLDSITGEMLRASPSAAAKVLWPLFAKAAAHISQPVQWRGGLLYEAYKQSGCGSDPKAYRSLFVSSTVGKSYHKIFRTKQQDKLGNVFHSFHMGARKGCPVTLPALYILSHLRRGQALRRSVATLYLDTEAAYYRIVRQLAFGTLTSDDAVVRVFQHFGLDPDDISEMLEQVVSGGIAAEAGIPDATRHNIKDFHHRSWFITAYSDGAAVTQTEAGSRPGESWSDLVFGWVYARILAKVTEHATAEQILDELPYDPGAGPYASMQRGVDTIAADATWADDSAWPLSDTDPERLVRKAVRLCTLVITFCRQHGLRPNLKPGKSAIMLNLRGRGSYKARVKYFPASGRQLRLPELEVAVPIVNQYRHLGGVVDGASKLTIEARRRTAMAGSAYDAGKQIFFANPRIALPTKIALFQAVIDPIYFNLGLWLTEDKSWRILSDGYTRTLRRLLVRTWGGDEAFHIPLAAVHLTTATPPLDLMLKRARLSLLCSIAKAEAAPLWAMLQHEQRWYSAVCEDLRWVTAGTEDKWPSLREANWPEWAALCRHSALWFKRQVRRRLKEATKAYCERHRVTLTLWALYRKGLPSATTSTGSPTRWTCRMCKKGFRARAGLGVHFFKVHQRTASYRGIISGTVCFSCGKDYHSENRLLVHLRDAPGCAEELRARGYRADQMPPGIGSKLWRANAQASDQLAVPTNVRQPLMQTGTAAPTDAVRDAYAALSDRLLCRNLPRGTRVLRDLLVECLDGFPLYLEEIEGLVSRLREDIGGTKDEIVGDYWTEETYAEVMEALRAVESSPPSEDAGPAAEEVIAAEYSQFAKNVETFEWDNVPPSSMLHETPEGPRFVLHDTWEAEWRACSGEIHASAVEQRLWTLVPATLQAVWLAALQGHKPSLVAPEGFWFSPLARPFARFRAASAFN